MILSRAISVKWRGQSRSRAISYELSFVLQRRLKYMIIIINGNVSINYYQDIIHEVTKWPKNKYSCLLQESNNTPQMYQRKFFAFMALWKAQQTRFQIEKLRNMHSIMKLGLVCKVLVRSPKIIRFALVMSEVQYEVGDKEGLAFSGTVDLRTCLEALSLVQRCHYHNQNNKPVSM